MPSLRSLLAAATLPAAWLGGAHLLRRRRQFRPLSFEGATPEALRFPEHLRFGAATAAHQVEGGTANNNWTAWEASTRPDGRPGILTGERCGQAADHWHRFEDDLDRMQNLGLQMYRFSIEWSRLEPEEGRFDDAALDRYRSWCEQLRAAGITPMVTLHHFTEPLWITDRGGFEARSTAEAFRRFAEHVVPRLADVVNHWITVNEPVVYATLGWYRGEFPPGAHDPSRAARVTEHLLRAHAAAYHVIHAHARPDVHSGPPEVGIAKNVVPFQPRRWWHPVDVYLAAQLDGYYNRAVLEALQTGQLRIHLPGFVRHEAAIPELAGTWDVFGLNHYFRQLVGVDLCSPDRLFVGFDPRAEKNDMGWDLTPQSFYDALMTAARYGKPIYVTEHGMCDAAEPDRRRRRFLLHSLYALQEAIRDGADVRAYLHWSLLDNFEWAHGFGPRFGLYRVDYATQARTLTGGGELYRRILARHAAR